MKGSLLRAVAAALLVSGACASAEAHDYGYVYGAGYGYTYGGPAYVPAVAYRPVVVHRPVVVAPVVPVVYSDPYCAPAATTVRVSRWGRRVETRTYTPYGVHEWEYKYDRHGRLRDVDYDFDD